MPPKVPVQQFAFTSGQMDVSLIARKDLDRYYKGGKEITNFVLLSHGGLESRGGLELCAEVSEAAAGRRLASFEFSGEQAYLHVHVNLKIKVYLDGVWQVDIPSPWSASELSGLDWTQRLDTGLITHVNYPQQKLMRTGGHASWSLTPLVLTNQPTYRYGDPTTSSGTPSGTTGGITFTSGAAEFAIEDVGKYIIGNQGKALITGYNSATSVSCTTSQDFKDITAIEAEDWTVEELAWSATRGYPGSVALYQRRSYWGGLKELLESVFGSRSGGRLFNFKSTYEALEDEAVTADCDGEGVNAVQRVVGLDSLFMFTSGGVFAATESPVKPLNFIPIKQTSVPSAPIRPVEMEDTLLFIAADENGNATTLHELLENADSNKTKYVAQDLNIVSSDVLNSPVALAARKGRPDATSASHGFVINGDGTAGVVHSRRRESVLGWTGWNTPGNALSDRFLDVAVVGGVAYFLVRRTIGGVVKYFIEKLNPDAIFDCSQRYDDPKAISGITQTNPVVVTATAHGISNGEEFRIDDVDLTYNAKNKLHSGMIEVEAKSFFAANVTANTIELQDEDGNNIDGTAYTAYVAGGKLRKKESTLSGFAHAEGETLKVFADGALRDDAVVTGGVVMVKDGGETITAGTIEAGMLFTWVAETMPLEAQLSNGTLVGETHKLAKATVRVSRAHDLWVNGKKQSFHSMRTLRTDTPLRPYTGLKTVRFLGWNRKSNDAKTVRCTGHLPINIESITAIVAQ